MKPPIVSYRDRLRAAPAPAPTGERRRRLLAPLLASIAPLLIASGAPGATAPLARPDEATLAEARALVEAMKTSERGPYTRIRWYCKDGSVLPPEPYACRERGGGRQHAEYSPQRQRLAELGWSVGTVVAALGFDELWDGERRNQRLRELPVERYLVDVDEGWVLRRARFYRGRVQVEDEERFGRELLVRLLSRNDWVAENFLLAREAVRTLPYHGGSDRTAFIRRSSQEIAESDRSFEPIRVKIHTAPGARDAELIRRWLDEARRRGAPAERIAAAERLGKEISELYGGGAQRIAAGLAALARSPLRARLEPLLAGAAEAPAAERVRRFAAALAEVRRLVAGSPDGAVNLALMDLGFEIEIEVSKAAFELLAAPALPRGELLRLAGHLAEAGFGSGLLSQREREALTGALEPLTAGAAAPTSGYLAAVQALRRAGSWALGTVRYTFAEALLRYSALEPEAQRYPDDLLRGSPMLALGEVAGRLAADADLLAGRIHRVLGKEAGGILALNPGVAIGPLRLARVDDRGYLSGLERPDIAILPKTVSELEPVAGILTLAEGNLLSHVQILARNLGIPNASIPPALARELTARAGSEALLAVGSDGSVLLERVADLPASLVEALAAPGGASAPAVKVNAPRPDFSALRPLALDELRAGLAGRVVGPKAANLGELAHNFPGRVAPAIALPFGIFHQHVNQGPDSPRARLDRAFAAYREGRLGDEALAAEVEAVRLAIAGLAVSPELRRTLAPMMERHFGPPGTYGAFVRSDTNVEDLPGFTGAGLNMTVANVVGLDSQLAAIPSVWSSPFSQRAMAWRGAILNRPEEVYSSVLLMKSVPADKSGVLVTADLATRREGLTVATSWGVGGAVDNEAAETLVLRADGSVTLIGEAKAAYRRALARGGGVEWIPAPAGRVLTEAEQGALRDLAEEVRRRLEPAAGPDGKPLPWDIEFGFVGGELTLFQIRPLVERGQARADRILAELLPQTAATPLSTPLETPVGRPDSEAAE